MPLSREDLLTCPFCGSNAQIEDHRTIFSVNCTNELCDAVMLGERSPEPTGDESDEYWIELEKTAITRWNKRAEKLTVAQVKAMIEKKAEHAMFSVHYALKDLLKEIEEGETLAIASVEPPQG